MNIWIQKFHVQIELDNFLSRIIWSYHIILFLNFEQIHLCKRKASKKHRPSNLSKTYSNAIDFTLPLLSNINLIFFILQLFIALSIDNDVVSFFVRWWFKANLFCVPSYTIVSSILSLTNLTNYANYKKKHLIRFERAEQQYLRDIKTTIAAATTTAATAKG